MVLMQEDKMIAGLVPEEGGGGHVIQNASGTAVAQEPTMQFMDSHVSDDSENDKTVIENIKPLTGAEFDVVTEDGFYAITDEDDATMEDTSADYVEVTADGEKTVSTLLNELYALIDRTKIGENTQLVQISGNDITCFKFARIRSDRINFYSIDQADTTTLYTTEYSVRATNSTGYNWNVGVSGTSSVSNLASVILSSGVKYILYYGTDSCVTDLINQAKYTYMESGESVESALSNLKGTEYKSYSIVDISAYNSNENCYVCPSEGYVRVGTSGDAMFMNGAGIIESAGNSVSVYVHKGAKVYGKNGSSNASSLRFIPLK